MFRSVLLPGARPSRWRCSAVPARAQVRPLAVDAQAFGARETIRGSIFRRTERRSSYIGPGPGPSSVVFVADLAARTAKPILPSSGNPEKLSWCNFATNQRLVCGLRRSSRMPVC